MKAVATQLWFSDGYALYHLARLCMGGTFTVKSSGAKIGGQIWVDAHGKQWFWDGINWYNASILA